MPDTTFLHIQTRGRTPARVVELPGDSARVGRGSQCEVRLGEPSLAEVECLLRRRGDAWDVQPLGTSGRVTIDGRRVEQLRALVPGVPLSVGDYVLTLRPSGATTPGFGTFESPLSGDSPTTTAAMIEDADPAPRAEEHAAPDLAAKIRDDHESRQRWHRSKREQRLWEARWRAAGESLRARAPSPAAAPRRPYPSSSVPSRPGWSQPEPPRNAAPEPIPSVRLLVSEPPDDFPAEDELARREWDEEPSETPPGVESREIPAVAPSPFEGREAIGPSEQESPPLDDAGASPAAEVEALATPTAPPLGPIEPPEFDPILPAPGPTLPAPSLLTPAPIPPRRPRSSRRATTGSSRPPRTDPPLPAADDLEWPSARVILAMQPAPAVREPAARRPRAEVRPIPTASRAPGQWSLPAWSAAIPALVLLVGLVGPGLAWMWGQDDREAGSLADRLLRRDAKADDLSAEVEGMPDTTWWRSTAEHLALRSAAAGRGTGDPDKEEKARFFLGMARNASPLEPSTRLALAGLPAARGVPTSAIASLGMSRDVIALAWTGKQLARGGRTDAAISAFRSALDLAVRSDPDRASHPSFGEDGASRRFTLPNEDLIGRIVRVMAAHGDWSYDRWAPALPDHGLVLLAAHRVLKETSARDADKPLDRLVSLGDEPALGPVASHRAAKAEGLAARGRGADAVALYHRAIEAVADESVRRTWWYNLAEILKVGDDRDRPAAIDAFNEARAGRGDDEIGRRAGQALAGQGTGDRAAEKTPRSAPGAAGRR